MMHIRAGNESEQMLSLDPVRMPEVPVLGMAVLVVVRAAVIVMVSVCMIVAVRMAMLLRSLRRALIARGAQFGVFLSEWPRLRRSRASPREARSQQSDAHQPVFHATPPF